MGELLVRTWHESQGKPIYVVQERRTPRSADGKRRPEPERPQPRPLTRVLFLTESFHPVLGGGEAHLRGSVGALSRAATSHRGDAAWRGRRGPRDEVIDGIRVRRVPPCGPRPRRQVPDGARRDPARRCARRAVTTCWSCAARRVLGVPGLLAGRLAGLPVVMQPETNGELDGEAFTWGKPWAERLPGRLVRAAVRRA